MLPLEDSPAALFYMRSREIAERCHERRIVYCHATKADGSPQPHNPEIFSADWIVPHFGGESSGWIAKVANYSLREKASLAEKLGIPVTDLSVSHYHVFELGPLHETAEIRISNDFSKRKLKGRPLAIPLGKVFS